MLETLKRPQLPRLADAVQGNSCDGAATSTCPFTADAVCCDDWTDWTDALLMLTSRHSPPMRHTSMLDSDFYSVSTRAPRRTTREAANVLRLEASPFSLSRRDLAGRAIVSLRGRGLTSSDAALLSMALAGGSLHSCEDLDLGCNKLGDAGLEALSIVLGAGALPQLKSLCLTDNGIGDEGVGHLARALSRRGNGRLHGLYLGRNEIGDAGVEALLSSAGGLAGCRVLQLCHNKIGDAGLTSFAAAVADGACRIERLWLNHNLYFEGEGANALAAAIDAGALPQLRELHIDDAEGLGIKETGMKVATAKHGVSLAAGRVLQPRKVRPKYFYGGGRMKAPPGE